PGPRAMGQVQGLQQLRPPAPRVDDRARERPKSDSADSGFEVAAPPPVAQPLPAAGKAVQPPPPPPSANEQVEVQAENIKEQEALKKNNVLANKVAVTGYSKAGDLMASWPRVAAPGGKTLWSLGTGGEILHSGDGGRSWKLQASGVTAALSAGSAPSDKVCW